MYIDILYGRYHQDMENIPAVISGDTEHIYNFIYEFNLTSVMSDNQVNLMSYYRNDIGVVPIPDYFLELTDEEIEGASQSIDIPLTSSDEIKAFITFIRDNNIPAFFFG
tara:strand:- start:317 stop:643 length:327 start_codon:yes stop_codon:yes gene_type:complete